MSVVMVDRITGPRDTVALWEPSGAAHAAQEGWLGLLLLDGRMIRQVTVGKRSGCGIFGPGDLIRPWDADGDYDPLTVAVAWLVSSRRAWRFWIPPSRCASPAGRASPVGSSAG